MLMKVVLLPTPFLRQSLVSKAATSLEIMG
jgi:hypothetical protein